MDDLQSAPHRPTDRPRNTNTASVTAAPRITFEKNHFMNWKRERVAAGAEPALESARWMGSSRTV